MKKGISDLDISLGKRLRLYRVMCGLSQAELGQKLGISPQQVQKYEAAKNRLSASRLVAISAILKIPLSDFLSFDSAAERINIKDHTPSQHVQQLDLLENYLRISKQSTRRLVSQLIRELARLSA